MIATLKPDNNWRIPYAAPRRPVTFHVIVESEHNVDAYVVHQEGLEKFDDPASSRFPSVARSKGKTWHEFWVSLPPGRDWTLLVVNWSREQPTAVYCNTWRQSKTRYSGCREDPIDRLARAYMARDEAAERWARYIQAIHERNMARATWTNWIMLFFTLVIAGATAVQAIYIARTHPAASATPVALPTSTAQPSMSR